MYFVIVLFCILLGMFFTWISWAFPVPSSSYFIDWFAAIFYIVACIILIGRMYSSQAIYLFKPAPKSNEKLILYVHRDQQAEFRLGKKVRDTSFIDIPGLGIIHDLGRDAVLKIGDKYIRMVPENISYPLPLWVIAFINKLQRAGFNDLEEVYKYLNGELDKKRMNELTSNLLKIETEVVSKFSELEERIKEKLGLEKAKLEKLVEKEKKIEEKDKIRQIEEEIDGMEVEKWKR